MFTRLYSRTNSKLGKHTPSGGERRHHPVASRPPRLSRPSDRSYRNLDHLEFWRCAYRFLQREDDTRDHHRDEAVVEQKIIAVSGQKAIDGRLRTYITFPLEREKGKAVSGDEHDCTLLFA